MPCDPNNWYQSYAKCATICEDGKYAKCATICEDGKYAKCVTICEDGKYAKYATICEDGKYAKYATICSMISVVVIKNKFGHNSRVMIRHYSTENVR